MNNPLNKKEIIVNVNHQIVLVRRSDGEPVSDDFKYAAAPMPSISDGEILIKNHYLSLDPYLRSKVSGKHMSGAVLPGEVMAGETIGEVLETRHANCAVGEFVRAMSGWQEYAAFKGDAAHKLDLQGVPQSLGLGVLGMPGLTGYAGVNRLSEIKEGETFLVSAASGPVGSMAAQTARMKGARTVGIAGSDEKCAWLKKEARFDDAINYKEEDLRDGIKRACPDGVDVYFDAVGGDTLLAVVENLSIGGRIILYGAMSEYNSDQRQGGPRPGLFIVKRATVRGLVVYDHEDLRPELERVGAEWIRNGDVAYKEDMTEGLENAPEAFARLMRGQNFGKAIVRIV